MKIDQLDKKILSVISNDARISFRHVAEECGVSRAAVHQHVQRMIEKDIITGSGYRVNPKDLGYTTCTYIGVRLERAGMYKEVLPQFQKVPQIVECYYTTGPYSMLLKVYARDNADLMNILSDRIQVIEGVASTETLISLAEGFVRSLPLIED